MDIFRHKHGDIHFVVIDGIADLIRSANDEMVSIAIVSELYRSTSIIRQNAYVNDQETKSCST